MNILNNIEPLARNVSCTDDTLKVALCDGREISVPLVWFPRLLHASQEQRDHWRLIGDGMGIHWEEIDEDISVESLLTGLRHQLVAKEQRFELIDP
jgi:hypothetical protein